MSIHVPGFKSVFGKVLHHFVLAKLAISSIRIKKYFGYIFSFEYYTNDSLHNNLK